MSDSSTFTCPRCGMTSYHPKDAEYGWCGACEDFTEPRARLRLFAWHEAWVEVLIAPETD